MLTPLRPIVLGIVAIVAFFFARTLDSTPRYGRRSILLGAHKSERVEYWERLVMIVMALIAVIIVVGIHHK